MTPAAVRDGLRSFRPDAHRIAEVASEDGITWIDDSKATNPHAAAASLASFDHVVWIAGGQLKGSDVDELVAAAAGRLRGAILLGVDRDADRAGSSPDTRRRYPSWTWRGPTLG